MGAGDEGNAENTRWKFTALLLPGLRLGTDGHGHGYENPRAGGYMLASSTTRVCHIPFAFVLVCHHLRPQPARQPFHSPDALFRRLPFKRCHLEFVIYLFDL